MFHTSDVFQTPVITSTVNHLITLPSSILSRRAILTARVCQLYPNAPPAVLIQKFFRVFASWRWPSPVHLKAPVLDSSLRMKVWNPEVNPKDRADLMPIITPAYPCINSTHNVSPTTFAVLMRELRRGFDLTMSMDENTPTAKAESIFAALVERTDFFTAYKHYLEVKITAGNEAEMEIWHGWVQSKLRRLIMGLETCRGTAQPPPFDIHPLPGEIKDTVVPYCERFYFALNIAKSPSGAQTVLDFSPATEPFLAFINAMAGKTETMTIAIGFLKATQLPVFVFPDDKRPEGWGAPKKKKKRPADGSVPSTAEAAEQPTTGATTEASAIPTTDSASSTESREASPEDVESAAKRMRMTPVDAENGKSEDDVQKLYDKP